MPRITRPEKYFLIFSFIVGCILILLTPIGAGFDEDTHVARIWEMSSMKIIPNSLYNSGPNFPSIFLELSYRQKNIIEPISFKDQLNSNNKIDWSNMVLYYTRATYFPTSYIFQAILMGLMGRVGNLSVNFIYMFLRLSYLLIYLVLVFLSIKLIPLGKWSLVFTAITPMALIQASIISPDSIVIGGSFIFIAWIFYLKYREPKPIATKEVIITFFLSFILCSVKPNNFVLLLLLTLVPANSFKRKSHKYIFIVIDILLMLAIYLLWFYKVSTINKIYSFSEDVDAFAQINFILKNPDYFISAMVKTIHGNINNYLQGLIGVSGYDYFELPDFVYVFYLFGFAMFSLFDTTKNRINYKDRISISIIIIAFIISTFLLFYCMNSSVASPIIDGIQGRYFLPLLPLIILVLPSLREMTTKKRASGEKIPGLLFFLILGISLLISIYYGYYVNCGISKLNNQVCSLPNYKNWDLEKSNRIIIKPQHYIMQTIKPECNAVNSISLVNKNDGKKPNNLIIQIINESSGTTYFGRNVSLTNLGINDFITVGFKEPILLTNSKLIIFIKNISSQDISLGAFERDEYPYGVISLDGEERDYDLIFKYTCQE